MYEPFGIQWMTETSWRPRGRSHAISQANAPMISCLQRREGHPKYRKRQMPVGVIQMGYAGGVSWDVGSQPLTARNTLISGVFAMFLNLFCITECTLKEHSKITARFAHSVKGHERSLKRCSNLAVSRAFRATSFTQVTPELCTSSSSGN